jgi:alanine dehydrogenase
MSDVAGCMATQEVTRFLEPPQGGKAIFISGTPGIKPTSAVILGAGTD